MASCCCRVEGCQPGGLSPNTAKLQSKYSQTMRLFGPFYTFRWYQGPRRLRWRGACTPHSLPGLVCLNRTSQHGVAGLSRRVYSNSHLPFQPPPPSIPVTACSCCLATGRVLRERESEREREKRGVKDERTRPRLWLLRALLSSPARHQQTTVHVEIVLAIIYS